MFLFSCVFFLEDYASFPKHDEIVSTGNVGISFSTAGMLKDNQIHVQRS